MDYSYSYSASGQMSPVVLIIWLAVMVFYLYCMWKLFVKAGKPGWACIIPIYNFIVLLQVVGKPWWWLILMLIPFVNFIILILVMHNLSLRFGKGAGFTVGLIFLSIIFIPILALGSAKYTPPPAMPAAKV